MKKRMLRAFLKIITVAILLIGMLIFSKAFSYYFGPESLGPRNAVELCNALGRDPDSDPLCTYQKLGTLLRDTFPPGEATVDDVHEKLEKYIILSKETVYGTRESYAIQRYICCIFRPEAEFKYDEDGILLNIHIMD